MAKLEADIRELESPEKAEVLALRGSLESDSLSGLQRRLGEMDARAVRCVAVEAQELTYVNRAGFMVLVNFSKRLRERGGDLVLCGLTPQVQGIFNMLRLQSYVEVVPDLEAAVQYLEKGEFGMADDPSGADVGGSSDASDTHSDLDLDEALTHAGDGPVEEDDLTAVLGAGDDAAGGLGSEDGIAADLDSEFDEDIEEALAAEDDDGPSLPDSSSELGPEVTPGHFPVFLLCQQCSANLQVDRPGPFRCPRCGNLFRVEEDGTSKFLELPGPRPIRMELVTTTECTRGLIDFVGAVAKGVFAEGRDVADFQRAVGAVCRQVRDTAYAGDVDQSYQVLVVPGPDRLVVEIADSGERVEPAMVRAEARKLVDVLEIKPRLGGGNFYKLAKWEQDLPEDLAGSPE